PAPPAPTPPPAAAAPPAPPPAAPPAPASPGPRAPAAPEGPSSGQRALGYGGIGVGSALLGVALYYGYRVKVESDAARERCPTSPCADEEGVRRNESARDSATIANVSAALGLVTLGVGLYVTLRSSPSPSPAPAAAPARASLVLVPGPRGASLVGAF
ncbi:MAG TPA: hypothetical protein VFS43_28845, partial [Polyangiaceae bacterium]|nr:hypothetical protein [Polyangiaceae bacterium]